MPRYIDADALLKHEVEADRMGAMLVVGKGHILNALEVDVAPVVRCGECKKRFMPDCPMQFIEKQSQVFICRRDDDYCSYGERKESENT